MSEGINIDNLPEEKRRRIYEIIAKACIREKEYLEKKYNESKEKEDANK